MYAHGFCFAVLCCGYTWTDFPIPIRLTSLALWQSNDCPSASKATLMNMDKYFMWIHYERFHNHNKAKHNKTVCIFLGIYCMVQISKRSYSWLRCCVAVHSIYVFPEQWHTSRSIQATTATSCDRWFNDIAMGSCDQTDFVTWWMCAKLGLMLIA